MNAARTGILALSLALAGGAWAQNSPRGAGAKKSRAPRTPHVSVNDIKGWSEASKKAAQEMLDRYGQPTEVTATMWIWKNNAPWKRTVVFSEALEHRFPIAHPAVLLQELAVKVAPDKFDELAKFDGGLVSDRLVGTLSVRGESESMNFVTLNVANEILGNKRTVDAARRLAGEIIALVKKGERPPYSKGLIFGVSTEPTGDPDQSL